MAEARRRSPWVAMRYVKPGAAAVTELLVVAPCRRG